MNVVKQSTFSIIFIMEFLMGNVGNGFIVLVNCVDWVKRRKISSVDQILTALAISRIAQIWVLVISLFLSVLYSGVLTTTEMFTVVKVPWTVANHFSIWLATCLSIFYFLKIAIFSNSTFLYLKWRAKRVILGTLMLSLIILFTDITLLNIPSITWVDGYKGNISHNSDVRNSFRPSKVLMSTFTVSFLIPFIVSLTTFLLLIVSLWKHLRAMQHKAPGGRDVSTTAHVRALQTVIVFLLLYCISFLSYVVQFWSANLKEQYLIISLCQVAIIAFPSAHSFVLILADNKLRRIFLFILRWLPFGSKALEYLAS